MATSERGVRALAVVRERGPKAFGLRLSGTLLAQHFRFRCDRKLRWELPPGGDPEIPEPAAARPGAELLKRAGIAFERRRVSELERRFPGRVMSAERGPGGSLRTLPAAEVLRALRSADPPEWIVQPELLLSDPSAFAERHGFDPAIRLAAAKPDLLRVRRGANGRLRLGLVDIKWSRRGTLQHFAQVAFYSLVLEEMVRHEELDAVVETRRAWLWTRGSRGPHRFALAGYRHHVREFLRLDLPRVAATPPAGASWHVGAGCAGCGFLTHCLAEADATDDVARVVGITPLARQELRSRGYASVDALRRAAFRRDVYVGCHALEANATALKARVQALSFGKVFDVEGVTHRMAPAEGVRVFLTADSDPVSGRVFALGARVEAEMARPVTRAWVSRSGTAAAEAELVGHLLGHLAAQLPVAAAAGDAPSLQLYVYERREAEALRGLLQRHMGDPAIQPLAAALAGRLFPATRGAGTAPGSVLLDVIAELFALPVPYAWDLASVSTVLQPDERAAPFRPAAEMVAPFASQIAFERIHRAWANPAGGDREAILRTVEAKAAALDSVLRAVRERASRREDRPRLLMRPGRLGAGDAPAVLADPALERLRTFVQLEAAEQSAAVRQLHALSSQERAARFECIRGLERVEVRDDGTAVFEFDPACREAKFRPGDFALLLTNDDGRTLTSTHTKHWLARRLMVELVEYDLTGARPRVVLASEYGWARLEAERLVDFSRQCVLDRAEADFISGRVIKTLEALDAGAGCADFPRALLRGETPAAWQPAPLDAAVAEAGVLGGAAAVLGRPVLNQEQLTAWAAAFTDPLSVVWGPPGTGKTYLLAWTLLGLCAASRARGRPLRVLVCAATHRAIANALGRVAREQDSLPPADRPRLAKLVGRVNEADRDLEGSAVELLPEDRLATLLSEADGEMRPVIVGATPWSLWKQMRAATGESPVAPLFDVVVVDEASQMRVADALVPLSSIREGGRALFYGDDRQLAPIVHGDYEQDPLFGSAFGLLSAGFGSHMLRQSRRMNRVLVRYPRRLFYPGLVSSVPGRRLRVDPATAGDAEEALLRELFLHPDDAVVFCVYSGVRAAARNPWEAALVARIARLARRALLDPETGAAYADEAFRREAFAVIAPHRAQNSAILAELAAGGWTGALPVVDTVERMQGNEREMVVVSYGVADREYAEREAAFLLDPNRFNVAITRARSKLVVLVSEEVMRALPHDEQVMADSLALKGYPAAPGGRSREATLPGPQGPVRLVCHRWSLGPRPVRGPEPLIPVMP